MILPSGNSCAINFPACVRDARRAAEQHVREWRWCGSRRHNSSHSLFSSTAAALTDAPRRPPQGHCHLIRLSRSATCLRNKGTKAPALGRMFLAKSVSVSWLASLLGGAHQCLYSTRRGGGPPTANAATPSLCTRPTVPMKTHLRRHDSPRRTPGARHGTRRGLFRQEADDLVDRDRPGAIGVQPAAGSMQAMGHAIDTIPPKRGIQQIIHFAPQKDRGSER